MQGDPRLGLLGCSAFAVLGGYIGLLHTAQDMMINLAIATSTAALLTVRLIPYYDTVLAACAFLLVLVLNVAFPFAVHWLVHALGSDLRHSSRDTLHGSVDPPGLLSVGIRHAATPQEGPSYLGVAMIDLDNFKRLNDTHGHFTGDQALVAVGGALRLASQHTSLIAALAAKNSSSPTPTAPTT